MYFVYNGLIAADDNNAAAAADDDDDDDDNDDGVLNATIELERGAVKLIVMPSALNLIFSGGDCW